MARTSGVARRSEGLVNVAWVVLHCNRRIGARERRQLIPHVRFQVISGAVPKMGQRKWFFFCSFTKRCMRSQKWDRLAVPFVGPCSGSFFEVCCIKVAETQRFGFNEALWLMATGRATREALLSEAGFEKVFRTQNWVRWRKLFCR